MLSELLFQSMSATEGPAYWFLNNLNIVIATSESTGGAFSLVHNTTPPGGATPYHLHHVEDEAFFVLDGEFTFICDGTKTVVGPGGYIFLPRNIAHGIRCTGSAPSQMLILATPGTGFVGMMTEMAEPAAERILPIPTAPDIEKLTMLCAKYKIDILGHCLTERTYAPTTNVFAIFSMACEEFLWYSREIRGKLNVNRAAVHPHF